VDCNRCVQVCPTGIDIRAGLQYECIGCAACIDACDQVMVKMDYPKGLIRYSTEHAIEAHWGWKEIIGHVVRPRVIIYAAILGAICLAFVWGITTKANLRVDVIRDRATLAREVEGGLIENVYRLHVINVSETPHRYAVSVSGLPGIDMVGDRIIEVPAAGARSFSVQVRVPPEAGKKGSNQIFFDVKSLADEKVAVHEKASFLQP
jgi:cytochrome c oxidase accessory protein FixG